MNNLFKYSLGFIALLCASLIIFYIVDLPL